MAFYGAFWQTQFAWNTYQVVTGNVEPAEVKSSGRGWRFDRQAHDREEAIRESDKLAQERLAKDKEIRAMEKRRKDRLDDKALQIKLLALMQEAENLRLQQVMLQQIIYFKEKDEEDLYILLASSPYFC